MTLYAIEIMNIAAILGHCWHIPFGWMHFKLNGWIIIGYLLEHFFLNIFHWIVYCLINEDPLENEMIIQTTVANAFTGWLSETTNASNVRASSIREEYVNEDTDNI